ncbi:MAG: hemerythrin domain-containing protein [bacterium]
MHSKRTVIATAAILVLAGALGWVAGLNAAPGEDEQHDHNRLLTPPPALRAEHERLHERLGAAKEAGGKTAEAAARVSEHLAAHFEEEEAYAMPPIGLLQPLAEGEATEDMRPAIEMADKLQANYQVMLDEHERILEALVQLERAARAEDKPEQVRFARDLIHHAKVEEQVLYPATIVIGKYLRTQLDDATER